jgi:hypothetical protein
VETQAVIGRFNSMEGNHVKGKRIDEMAERISKMKRADHG